MNQEIHELGASALLRAFRAKTLSPVEVAQAIFARIGRFNGRVNAFCRLNEAGALEAARASEARWAKGEPAGLLDGVPISIKDLVWVKGMPTLYGSKTVDPGQPWDEDAPVTARLREAGAVILGKTCTPEFGHKFVTDSPLTGITRNAWNPERSPGGSSGGAGAAVALGLGPVAIGTDGGGSVRIPSAWSGIVGHKPTLGRVPSYPPSRWGTLSTTGPMTRSVEDAALMFTVITRPDPRDWFALPPDGRDYRIGLEDGVAGLRIAYSPDLGLCKVEPEIAACVQKAAGTLAELGARVDSIEPPGIEEILAAHVTIKTVIFTQQVEAMTTAQREVLDPPVREMHEAGKAISGETLQEALLARQDTGAKMHALHTEFDLLVTPTFHISPPPVPGMPEAMQGKAPYLTSWVNNTMQPAASVPCGLTREGLPVGLQIIGPKYADALVLRAARAYEAARGAFSRPPMAGEAG